MNSKSHNTKATNKTNKKHLISKESQSVRPSVILIILLVKRETELYYSKNYLSVCLVFVFQIFIPYKSACVCPTSNGKIIFKNL